MGGPDRCYKIKKLWKRSITQQRLLYIPEKPLKPWDFWHVSCKVWRWSPVTPQTVQVQSHYNSQLYKYRLRLPFTSVEVCRTDKPQHVFPVWSPVVSGGRAGRSSPSFDFDQVIFLIIYIGIALINISFISHVRTVTSRPISELFL